jgi:hypothetical protein
MKRFAAVFAILAVVGCKYVERPTYREPDPKPVEVPSPPPERILRRAPDFRFTDYESRKTFYDRGYAESLPGGGEFRHEVVTVRDPKGDIEREATNEERDYALNVLEQDWRNKGLEEQLRYHQELARIGKMRRDSMIDARIGYAEEAVKDLEERLVDLEADLQASTRTSGYTPPAGRVEFLTREIESNKQQHAELKARLETLRYLAAARDRAYGRSSRVTPGS